MERGGVGWKYENNTQPTFHVYIIRVVWDLVLNPVGVAAEIQAEAI